MKKAIEYAIVVCLGSWAAAGLFYLFGFRESGSVMARQVFGVFYMFIPMIVAMLLQRFRYREKFKSTGLLRFRIKGSWFAAWFFIPVLCVLAVTLSAAVPGITFSWDLVGGAARASGIDPAEMLAQMGSMPLWVMYIILILVSMIAGATVNAAAAFGEEYGWRNYMVRALHHHKFWKACLLIGFVWGIWHMPLILMGHNYPSDPVAGIPMMTLMCMVLTVPMMYFTLKTRSMIVAVVMHGTFNALAGIGIYMLAGGTNFTMGVIGWPGIAAMAILSVLLFVYDKFISRENIFTSTVEASLHRDECRARQE